MEQARRERQEAQRLWEIAERQRLREEEKTREVAERYHCCTTSRLGEKTKLLIDYLSANLLGLSLFRISHLVQQYIKI